MDVIRASALKFLARISAIIFSALARSGLPLSPPAPVASLLF